MQFESSIELVYNISFNQNISLINFFILMKYVKNFKFISVRTYIVIS